MAVSPALGKLVLSTSALEGAVCVSALVVKRYCGFSSSWKLNVFSALVVLSIGLSSFWEDGRVSAEVVRIPKLGTS